MEPAEPDHTAVRVALWRAMHVEVDAPPYVLTDEIGLQPTDPPDGWRERGDMHPEGTSRFRAREFALRGAAASGTPFISFYTPSEMVAFARDAGFRDVEHVSGRDLTARYFSNRGDGLAPSSGEDLLVARASLHRA